MRTIISCRPETGEPLLARTTQRVRSRAFAVAAATGAIIDPGASKRHPLLGDTIVMPFANLALMGTNCARPLKFEDGERIAREVGLDVVLMRYDIDRGASFDILDPQSMFWRCHHVAWRRGEADLWFIPQVGSECFIRAGARGLECQTKPPFVSEWERRAGIIRAIDNPSFEGRI